MIMAWICKKANFIMGAAISLGLLTTISQPALATFSLDLSGSMSNSYMDLEQHKSSSATASFLMGLGDYVIVSLGHQLANSNKDGYRKTQTSDGNIMYYEFRDDTKEITNFSDLTVILYQGMVSPFVFGGVARKDYYSKVSYPGTTYTSHIPLPLSQRYGLGVSLTLNREFRMKITQTFSPGVKIDLVDNTTEVAKKYVGTTTEVGISMRLN